VAVKADAYGHGAPAIARASLESGAFCLGVATVEEGAALRLGGIAAPVLLLSQPVPDEIPGIIQNGLSPFVSDHEFAGALNAAAAAAKTKLPVHLKIDTGMGRLGCTPDEAPALARRLAGCGWLEHAGTATHLAVSDSADPADLAYTERQLGLFRDALQGMRAAGLDPGIVHAANSGAIILHPNAWFDMVRPGILLYGYKAVEAPPPEPPLLVEPAMELRTRVVFVKNVKKGESVSYGRTWVAPRDTAIAVLPVGYADGLPRLASNRWRVSIGGGTYPLVGTICMDQCMADLGPDPKPGRWDDAAVLGGPALGADALAECVGTIPYEIVCNIGKRVPRVYRGA